ncbi:LysR family transcriptional regulator substrate-binding protein, partial [Salmonella enterica subsp. enterica serovar Kentucky]|nr:LysR family transcriptional regulator substrate-binding protein [Salmonella enterica subsp. enterica serovar Kentucky]
DKHPLAKKDSIDWEDLQYEPLILMKKDSWHRKTIIEECTKRGPQHCASPGKPGLLLILRQNLRPGTALTCNLRDASQTITFICQ